MQAFLLAPNDLEEMQNTLRAAGREDLASKLQAPKRELTSHQAAQLLGVSSANTVKNWLEGGQFPGARKTTGGHWRFPLEDVLEAKAQMEALRVKNDSADLLPPDGEDYGEPPLL